MSDAKDGKDEVGEPTLDPEEEQMADLVAFALTGRIERVEDGILMMLPPQVRAGVSGVRGLLATLGVAEAARHPAKPSSSVRARLLATLAQPAVKKALLVVDMINDHLEPGTLLEVPRARAIVPALRKRIDEAHAAGVPVVYIVDEHDPDDPDLDAWGTHAVRGSAGTEVWPELAPSAGDRIVKKASYSAFFESELSSVLDGLKVDTLILTGCLTEIGLHATATDAYQRGFAVEVPVDSQAGSCLELETTAVGMMNVLAPFGPSRKKLLDRLAVSPTQG